jgi:hypothetical protein
MRSNELATLLFVASWTCQIKMHYLSFEIVSIQTQIVTEFFSFFFSSSSKILSLRQPEANRERSLSDLDDSK